MCLLPQRSSTSPLPVATSAPPLPPIPIVGFPAPIKPAPVRPTPLVLPLPDLPLVPGCECEQMMCIQSYPASCHCAWGIAKSCYDKCGGPSPGINTCPPQGSLSAPFDGPVKRAPEPQPQTSVVGIPVSIPAPATAPGISSVQSTAKCTCEERFCILSWPAGCYCANKNKSLCWKKCGGVKPLLQVSLIPHVSLVLGLQWFNYIQKDYEQFD